MSVTAQAQGPGPLLEEAGGHPRELRDRERVFQADSDSSPASLASAWTLKGTLTSINLHCEYAPSAICHFGALIGPG